MNFRKRASTASGGGSSKFTVQTHECLRRGRSLVDDHMAAEVKTEDWLTLTVESVPGIRQCNMHRRRYHLPASDPARLI